VDRSRPPRPALPDRPLASRLDTSPAGQGIAALVARVEARLRAHPEDGAGWDVIAPVYLKHRRYRDAADAYGRAIRLLGENTRRLTGYGEALILANNGIVSETARKALERSMARDGTQLKAHFWLAMAKEQDGRMSEAAASSREAVDAEGDYTEAWNNLGNALAELDEPERAVEAFERALALAPAYADPHYNLAETLTSLGRRDAARRHWERYLELDPSSVWADEARQRLDDR